MRESIRRFGGRLTIRRLLAGAAFLTVSGSLVACGGSSSAGGVTTNAAAFGPGGQLSASDRECLQKHGLNLRIGPAGGRPPTGTNAAPPTGATGTTGTTQTYGAPPSGAVIGPQGSSGPTQMPENVRKAFQACGVQPPSRGSAGSPPSVNSAAFRQSVSRYVACVKQNGYDLPAPNLSGNGPIFDESKVNRDDPKFQSASQKCQQLLQPQAQGPSTADQ